MNENENEIAGRADAAPRLFSLILKSRERARLQNKAAIHLLIAYKQELGMRKN